MKSLLVFLAVIATALAWHNYAREERSWPKPLLPEAPWYHQKNFDFNMEANVQTESVTQDVFKAGQTYLIMDKYSKFLCCVTRNNGDQFVEALRSQPDESCRFIASTLENGRVSLRISGDEGKYLQEHNRDIRPTANAIIQSAQFSVKADNLTKWSGAHNVYLKSNTGRYLTIQKDNYVNTYDDHNDNKKLTVMEAR